MIGLEFTDRYKALGIPYPNPETVCRGQCEGTGFVPIHRDETEERFAALWDEAHVKCYATRWQRWWRFVRNIRKAWKWGLRTHWHICFDRCDGWHFVKCPDCGGTGKRVTGEKE